MKIKDLFKELLAICILVPLLYNFCNADNGFGFTPDSTFSIPAGNTIDDFQLTGFYCLKASSSLCNQRLRFTDSGGNLLSVNSNASVSANTLFCFDIPVNVSNGHTSNCQVSKYTIFKDIKTIFPLTFDCPVCEEQYSSLECQSEYSLIPISSVDSSYCESNNLCSNSGGGDCGSGSLNWSSLYINDIQHLGKPIISIDIPEEINWDYTSTDTEFNVEVIGYNVDYEKMNQVVSIQKYVPTSEDFTQVVGILAPYMKILVFVLFVYIVIRRLKKPFSSKMK